MELTQINCLIIDDEPPAIALIERYVKNTPYLVCVGSCNSAIEAINIINTNKIDLLFLDIQMPELSGIEFSRSIDKNTRIIFTTAFSQYAIEGYKVNALDYLLKPFNYDEFYRATQKAKEWFESKAKTNGGISKTSEDNFIFVKSEYKQVKINLNNVLYFEGLKDYIKIWIKDEPKPILTIMSLKTLENELNEEMFMRIHRSFIISLNNIQSVERGRVLMYNNIYITVAEQYKLKFQSFIAKRSLNH